MIPAWSGQQATPAPGTGGAGTPSAGRASSFLGDAWSELVHNPLFLVSAGIVTLVLAIVAFPGLFAGLFGHGNPHDCNLADSALGPRAGHPFGFDVQGCDLYANVVYGARDTVSIGLLVTASSLLVAIVLGSAMGYLGGLVDTLLGRTADVFFGFPFVLGALIILIDLPERNVLTVSLVLVIFGWPTMTRLMRSTVLSERNKDYVLAARALGASNFRILRKHILPNALAPVVIYATLTTGGIMVAEATLTFLGVGLQAPAISWGLELAAAQNDLQQYPHLLVFPGLFLSITVLSFVTLGDTLRDALDPRLR
ncbi:MAG TPA: ABC transporter permease [Acidimicrobiales bacterium]|nr:ABC transporter permease [Acidimicrobiales bacterium]